MIRITNEIHDKSSTYQGLLKEGGLRNARMLVLNLGTKKFGSPDETVHATITATTDIDRLMRIIETILTANSWAELLQTP